MLADSWSLPENLDTVLTLGHYVVMALEFSRTRSPGARPDGPRASFRPSIPILFPDEQPLRAWLRPVQPAVVVPRQVSTDRGGSQGVLYPISSDKGLNQNPLTTIYQRR